MNLTHEECRQRAIDARVGHLATVSVSGDPHLVPVTFVFVAGNVAIGIDDKPKVTSDLKRLRNIHENPRVALLRDKYDEDWSHLWWVRGDGIASIEEGGSRWEESWVSLHRKYPQYEARPLFGPVVLIEVNRWSGWAYRSRRIVRLGYRSCIAKSGRHAPRLP